jgi:Peptidase family C25/FlgD Ig-like domain
MKWLSILLVSLLGTFNSVAQEINQAVTIEWKGELGSPNSTLNTFEDCGYEQVLNQVLPIWYKHFSVSNSNFIASVSSLTYQSTNLSTEMAKAIESYSGKKVQQYISIESGRHVLSVEVFPYRVNKNNGQIEKLTSFQVQINPSKQPIQSKKLYKKASFATNSVLSTGDWHRFRIGSEGVYKITVSDLLAMNIDPTTVDISSYQIYGTEGGLVDEVIDNDRTDDLGELAIEAIDKNGNNRLDGSEYILFYSEGPHQWKFDENLKQYIHENNFYDSYNYAFLTHSQKTGKRIFNKTSGQGEAFDTSFNGYFQLLYHEKDLRNFIASGREWFGESFGKQNTRTFSHTIPNLKIGEVASLRSRFTGRSIQTGSAYNVRINNVLWHSATIAPVGGSYDQNFIASPSLVAKPFTTINSKIDLTYTFIPGASNADAWLDYYELSVPVSTQFGEGQHFIYSKESEKFNKVRFQMTGNGLQLWNMTDYFNGQNQLTYSESGFAQAIMESAGEQLRLVCFTNGSLKKPEYIGKVQSQNLHGLNQLDYLIVTHAEFEQQAMQLAEFHRNYNKYSVAVVRVNEVYNEFSGGKKDATAIRDLLRMLYERGLTSGTPLRYALLFGDGSYDYKDRLDKNTNFIPTFQGDNSYSPSYSYASDDYFSILDAGEGYFNITDAREGIDIGVGRIPCRNVDQAQTMVDKILRYYQPSSYGEWRNRLSFLGDDEDNNIHFNDTEQVSGFVNDQNPVYNINKIYLDAYPQQSFGSGEKYPGVNAEIDRDFGKGIFIFNYLGHGGPSGLAHERVLTREMIRNWTNVDALPVIITATCELTRYDDPSEDSPGELSLFNEHGGAIALITTTRLVYISLNRDLNDKVLDKNMFDLSPEKPSLGDIIRVAKNRSRRNVNQRNFTLIGDPAMILGYPSYNVVTTGINDSTVGQQDLDTFKAFSKIKINGEVRKTDGSLATDFNGIVYPTMFDKYLNYSTLANDPASKVAVYQMQNSVLYRGKVSVVGGKFSFQFVVPKDIAYQYGKGKLVYYASNGETDGNGYENSIIIGGSSSEVTKDEIGPEIDLFMDDFSFVFGGLTDTKPLLLCKVFDENGINTVGNGIGRDITAILDEGTEFEQILILNDFYQSTLDSYQAGELRYNMEKLEPGRHTLKVRVWDVYNNASEDYTEFVVADDADLTLGHILNYPNPFTTSTSFQFDHNKQGQNMDVQIQILSISGKVVKTFHYSGLNASSHFNEITWNGRDAFGDRLARGVYLYKVSAKSEDGSEAEAVEKLVLLK